MSASQLAELNWAQKAWLIGPHDGIADLPWRHRCHMRVALRKKVDIAQVKASFERVIAHFPMLRAQAVHNADGDVALRISPTASAGNILVTEIAGDDTGEVPQAVMDIMREEGRPNIGVVLFQNSTGTTLAIEAAHFFLDGESLATTVSYALRFLEGKEAPWDEEGDEDDTHRAILRYERSAAALRTSQRNIARLCAMGEKAVGLGNAGPYLLHSESSIGGAGSRSLGRACGALAATAGAPMPGVLLSLFLIARSALLDEHHTWLAVCSANRLTPDERRYVGLQTRHGALLADLGSGSETFAELVRRMTGALTDAVLNSRHDPDELLRAYRASGIPENPPCFFNFIDGRPLGSELEVDELAGVEEMQVPWVSAPSGRFALELNCFSTSGFVGTSVEHDPKIYPRDRMTELLSTLHNLAERAAHFGPEVTVGRLLEQAEAGTERDQPG
ncbi:hypothetical protein [Streptomyces sp. NPDC005827]|uniref:hypothetical protein n=1 Tax=Streptomyces sp. NPDC005827 TaxID=3157070 RepID=UPI0033CDFD38